MKKIAVLFSGTGTNLKYILEKSPLLWVDSSIISYL
jgi:folate-dependent phosphoribosylglycinamide formyltransferase PurN